MISHLLIHSILTGSLALLRVDGLSHVAEEESYLHLRK